MKAKKTGVHNTSLLLSLFALCQCFATILSAQVLSQDDFSNYFIYDRKFVRGLGLYDARTFELIVQHWPGKEFFFEPGEKEKIIFGSRRRNDTRQYTNNGKPDNLLKFQDGSSLQGWMYFSKDFSRLVYLKNKDLWICDVDWTNDELVNNRQLTHVGVFGYQSSCYWYEDILLVASKYRIDTKTGEIQEFDVGWFTQEERTSPDHRRIILRGKRDYGAGKNQYGVYDLLSGKAQPLGEGGNLRAYLWLDNNRFVIDWRTTEILYNDVESDVQDVPVSSKKVFNNSSKEFFNKNKNAVLNIRREHLVTGVLYSPSPDGRYFFTATSKNLMVSFPVLVDTQDWSTLPLPREAKEITWVGPELFYYSCFPYESSLKDRGTWVYNTATSTEKKIGTYPFSSIALLPDAGVVIFLANNDVWRAKVDGSEIVRLTETGKWGGEVIPLISGKL